MSQISNFLFIMEIILFGRAWLSLQYEKADYLKQRNHCSLRILLSLYSLLLPVLLTAQPVRLSYPINENWAFTKAAKTDDLNTIRAYQWKTISLPHTWNTDDVMDDTPGYYRGVGWYRKILQIDKQLQDKKLFLRFEGANQVTKVWINGKAIGMHTGGYTGFCIPITDQVIFDKPNELLVQVDNSQDADIPPLSADFTFYGGIYRNVSLTAVSPLHFSCSNYGSNGIYISTPSVSKREAIIQIRYNLSNEQLNSNSIKIVSSVVNSRGEEIASGTGTALLQPGSAKNMIQTIRVRHPHLWSPEDPYLYKVVSRLFDQKTGLELDEVSNPLGLRWFYFDAGKGFFLNGKSYKLVGTSRHQDLKGYGNAVPPERALEDVVWLKNMGANFLRVAHYPQDPVVLQACDSLGILASVEIPIVNEIGESARFFSNSRNMLLEMIRQNYNHPSVIIWCSMNEVLLRPPFNNDKIKQKKYFAVVTKLAAALDSITRKEDPYRYTMIACHGDYEKYRSVGLVDIPMIVGWNLYAGWYGSTLGDFPAFLDSFHKKNPHKPVVVSEYGADADPRIRSTSPVRFDKSIEYTTKFHQYYLSEMMKRPYVAAAMIWNLADFNSETRNETMPHMNNKGLLTWDRVPKDPYYYYKAMLWKEPYIKLLGTRPLTGVEDSTGPFCIRNVQVATNIQELTLTVNGKKEKPAFTREGLCEWMIPFINGENHLLVTGFKEGKLFSDSAVIPFILQPYRQDFNHGAFQPMNILLGANRYFLDNENQLWMPDQEYKPGEWWGHTGGRAFRIPGNNQLPYGSDRNITGTENDPVYQTQQTGIEKYTLQLPDGGYELTLHFAELAKEMSDKNKRIFNINVNGREVLNNLDVAGESGISAAVVKKIEVAVEHQQQIIIEFIAVQGEAILNALQVKRLNREPAPVLNVTGD